MVRLEAGSNPDSAAYRVCNLGQIIAVVMALVKMTMPALRGNACLGRPTSQSYSLVPRCTHLHSAVVETQLMRRRLGDTGHMDWLGE